MGVAVKICGIQDEEALAAAIGGGAAAAGFVFIPHSPNRVDPALARRLTSLAPRDMTLVGLFDNARDEEIFAALQAAPRLNTIQLHGDETPEDVKRIRHMTGLPVIKALRVSCLGGLDAAAAYYKAADYIQFDSRSGDRTRSGGPLDWRLFQGRSFPIPWLLAGGLSDKNLAEAVSVTGARVVDVSSGVDDPAPHKSPRKIRAFLALAASFAAQRRAA